MIKKLFLSSFLGCFVLSIGFLFAGPPKPPVQKGKPSATPMPKPDLVITSIEFKDIEYKNYGSEKCWFFKVYFTIKNQGNLSSGPFTLRQERKHGAEEYYYNGEIKITGLAPSETKTVTIEKQISAWCPPTPPAPFFKGTIDFYKEVSESNEDNNSIERQFILSFNLPIRRK